MSASLLDLVAKQRSVDGLASLAGWLDGRGSAREAGKVRELAEDVLILQQAADDGTTADVLAVVRSRIGEGGLDASATALDRWSHGAIAAHGDDLDALVELADLEPDPAKFPEWLSEQLGAPGDTGGVVLASIHAVKGREWPHVVLHHASAGLMPHRLAEDVEEERRVFHVGLTRCRTSASIVPGTPPSPFLLELAESGEPPPKQRAVDRPVTVTPPRRGTAASEPMPAAVGCRFTLGGQDHQVTEVTDRGVRSVVDGDSSSDTMIAFGTSVTVEGRPALLARPSYAEAWERLRVWRSDRAKAADKPAFVVLDDKTLRLVAAILPTTEAGLLAISGIGAMKLEAYGDDLIAIAEALKGSETMPGAQRRR